MDNLEINTISQLISTIGFPIVAFAAIFYLYDKTVKELNSTIAKIDNTLTHILTKLESSSTCPYLSKVKNDSTT